MSYTEVPGFAAKRVRSPLLRLPRASYVAFAGLVPTAFGAIYFYGPWPNVSVLWFVVPASCTLALVILALADLRTPERDQYVQLTRMSVLLIPLFSVTAFYRNDDVSMGAAFGFIGVALAFVALLKTHDGQVQDRELLHSRLDDIEDKVATPVPMEPVRPVVASPSPWPGVVLIGLAVLVGRMLRR